MIQAFHSTVAWRDGFLLGYAPMDQVHEEFIALVNALGRAGDDELGIAMDSLLVHAREHFGDEERWMAETEFPARKCHAEEHAAVLRSIEGVRERVVAHGDHAAARRLARALAEWFPGHADYLDAALAHWLCKRRFGGQPIVVRRHFEAPASVAEH
jgi:hemerythrin